MKHIFYHIILLLFLTGNSFAQEIAEARYSADSIKIGEQFFLELSFSCQKTDADSLVWPQFENEIANSVEILERSPLKKTTINAEKDYFKFTQKFTLTSFKSGENSLRAIEIIFRDSLYMTNSTKVFVRTVELENGNNIYDIKPIQEVEYKLGNRINDFFIAYWHWLVIIILVLVIAVLLYLYFNRKQPEIIIEAPKIPAHIPALKILKALAESKAWQNEDKKSYYSSVTDTVRKYLEERFDIQAMEETTDEIITDLKYSDILDKDKFFLQEILKQADMVKFAKFKPNNQDGEIVLDKSIAFVERTKDLDASNETKVDNND